MILLDTHVLIWWVSNPEKLSPKAHNAIEKAVNQNQELYISSISVWEICMLVKKGRLKLAYDVATWIDLIESFPQIKSIPVDNDIAQKSTTLENFSQNDPADRIIVATSLVLDA